MIIAIKEKLAFWILLTIFIIVFLIGLLNYSSRRIDSEEWLAIAGRGGRQRETKEIVPSLGLEFKELQRDVDESDYNTLLENSPFFRYAGPQKKAKESVGQEGQPIRKKEADFIFKGKMIVKGAVKVILEERNAKKTYLVGKGEAIGEYRIKDILEDEVVILKEPEEFHIKLIGSELRRESK